MHRGLLSVGTEAGFWMFVSRFGQERKYVVSGGML
jgi:hypothetical protein